MILLYQFYKFYKFLHDSGMAILLHNHGYDDASWLAALAALLPDEKIMLLDELTDANKAQIEFALVWDFPLGGLVTFPKLRAIFLLGAGTEHIDREQALPQVPVVRLIDPAVVRDMCAYSLYWVMHFHRNYGIYRQQQKQSHWQRHEHLPSNAYQVSVLGLGQIGLRVAEYLATNGLKVTGWDRNPITHDAIQCFHGRPQLPDALKESHVLINCLPLSADTQGFIDKQTLNLLPTGAKLINISRGGVVNDTDLLDALENGQLEHAVLDAHTVEPLPETSPYWHHPRVVVTPHAAGATYARSAAQVVVANIERMNKGEQAFPLHIPHCQKKPHTPSINRINAQ